MELFGHTTIAGQVQLNSVGELIRVDVPGTDTQPAFTKFYGAKAIYGITPTTEENARRAAQNLNSRPVQLWLVSPVQQNLPMPDPDCMDDSIEGDYEADLEGDDIPI